MQQSLLDQTVKILIQKKKSPLSDPPLTSPQPPPF